MPIKHTDREPTVFDRIVFSYRNCAILDDLRTTPLHTPAGARYLPGATKAEKIIPAVSIISPALSQTLDLL